MLRLGWILFTLLACVPAARAEFRSFVVGGQPVLLERAESTANAFFRAFRPNAGTGRWEVDLVVTNGSPKTLRAPVIMRFETAEAVAPGIGGATLDAEGKPYFNLTPLVARGGFVPGTALRAFTLTMGDGQIRPELEVALYSAADGPLPLTLGLVRTLTVDGLPMEGVTAVEVGLAEPRLRTVGRGGWLTLEPRAGVRGWSFSAPGMEPVFRGVDGLVSDRVSELLTVRLVPVGSGDLTRFPVEALPAPVPRGWSPAVVVRSVAGERVVELTEIVPVGREAVWVRWDEAVSGWRGVGRINGDGLRNVSFDFPEAGVFALLVPDTVPAAPTVPGIGEILAGVVAVEDPAGLRATGKVEPATAAASLEAARVTGRARVEFTSVSGVLSSGLEVPCEVVEEYRLRDGTRRRLPAYTLRLVAHRALGGSVDGPLVAGFPIRPFQLLAGEELAEAVVRVEVLAPEAFAGGVLRETGGVLAAGTVQVTAGPGDFGSAEAALLRELNLAPPTEFLPVELEWVRGFELGVGGLVPGRRLGLVTGLVPANGTFVLARTVFDSGRHGFQPVQRFTSDGAGVLRSVEPDVDGLPGIDGGGQYVLVRTVAAEGLVEGLARNAAGEAVGGLMIRRGPWTAFSDAVGRFQLLTPAGVGEVEVEDPVSGDSGTAQVEMGGGLAGVETVVDAAPRGPRVVTILPEDGATGVARVTPVVVGFNRGLNPATVVGGGVQLVGPGDVLVAASISLNVAGTTVTLLPTSPLAAAGVFRVRVAETVTDLVGRPVEGPREFGFTTLDDSVVRDLAAQVTIYEPGATNLTEAILGRIPAYDPVRDRDGIVVEGSPGTAESGQAVVLVNESTGETQTVLSDVDGSFVSFVRGTVDDFISAVLVNANGTRNQLPATRQRFDDGTIGLFGTGGTIRSTGPGVPVDLIVEPGSIRGKTLFKMETVEASVFGALIGGHFPEGSGALVGAFELTESGDPLLNAADISVPVKLSELGLPPGTDLTNVSFVVVMPLRVDGRVVHQIVDTATYEPEDAEGGRVRTASPPFIGMLARKLADLRRSAGMSVVTVPKVASNNDNPHKGETAAFGIMPLIARGPLKVGGFVRVLKDNADGTQETENLPGATVRMARLQDEQDGAPLVIDGDLVSISDERGNFGFLFRPSEATTTRALLATHPRFPFQRPRTIGFKGERQGTTVVNAELHFRELPPNLTAVEDISPPRVTVTHTPDLPRAGSGEGNGADLFVVGVDDKEVGPPSIVVQRVENLRGEEISAPNILGAAEVVADEPARKVRKFRLELPVPGRVVLQASVRDATGKEDIAAHAVSFGVSRPPVVPTDPDDNVALRVIFSWPPNGATNLPALTPIRIRFNRSLPASLVATPPYDWLAFSGGHFVRRVEADSERREITVFYDGPTTGPVRLSAGSGITGESGKVFDQDPNEQDSQPFTLGFIQARSVVELLEGETGAGAALLGRFGYTLERDGSGGRLGVWDFATPAEPVRVRDIKIGYPTAMALIPGYSLPPALNSEELEEPCVLENLLAVFTGHANEPKYLQLGRIQGSQIQLGRRLIMSGGATDGAGHPSVAEGVSGAASLSQIVKAKWDPPYLGYFELGADVTSVKMINLHAWRRVEQSRGRLDGFGAGADGFDANGDGDFCDSGDLQAMPDRDPLITPGMSFSFAPGQAGERYDDFDFHAGLGLVVSVGRFLSGTNAPRFTTLLAAGDEGSLTNAFVSFPAGETLRRVLLLPATTVDNGTNLVSRDLALVSISRGNGEGSLAVIDLTTPSAPVLTNRFDLPSGEGPAGSAQLRSDGLLAVASGRSTLLYDPTKLLRPAVDGVSPALVGRIDGTGTGVRDFVSDPTGIHLTYGGSNRRYVEAAPRFSFVRFNAVINPDQVAAQDAFLATGFLRSATPVTVADVMESGNGTNAPAMDPARHYYVLMDAPGGAADGSGRLPLVLSAVDANGMPQVERGGTPVPAVVGDEQLYSALLAQRVINLVLGTISVKKALTSLDEASGLVDKAKAVLKVIKSTAKVLPKIKSLGLALKLLPDKFVARRLSDDPNHPLYNRFLAGPFVVLGGSPSVEQLTALNEQAAAREVTRVYLRPSARLWVGLPSERAGGQLSFPNPFTPPPSRLPSFVSELRLNPTLSIFGVKIPESGRLIEEMAGINQLPGNPLSLFDMGEQVTLIVSLISEVPVVGKVLKGDWKPMLMPGAHQLLRVNHTERPMVLVPGFAASKLEINGVNHWLGLPQTASELAASAGAVFGDNPAVPVMDRARKDLRVQPDGTPAHETFATDMLRFSLEVPTQAGSIYGDWLNHLTGEMGFVEYKYQGSGLSAAGPQVRERLRLEGRPGLGQSPTPNLFVFPYDWRLDNQKAAEALRDYVRLALEMHPDADGIDLVGHSNGGLVSRAYMLMPGQRARVKRLITVGTPWLGSPKPLSGLKSGNLDDMAIGALAPIPAVRKMLQFSPGAHQLLPSREYFDLGFRPLVEDGYDVNTNGLPNEVFGFDGFQDVLARHFLRGPAEEFLNEPNADGEIPSPRRSLEDLPGGEHPVRENANSFRETQPIGDHSLDPADVEMHHIVGFGATPDTIGQLRIRGRLVPQKPDTNVVVSVARVSVFDSEQVTDGPALLIHPGDGTLAVNPTNQFRMNEEVELRYVAGDGTVPIGSLARGYRSGVSLNATHARVHALVGGKGKDITGHNPMLNTEEFFHIFDTVYGGREVEEIQVGASGAGGFTEGSLGTLTVSGVLPGGVAGAISFVADFGDGAVELRQGAGGTATFQHRYRQSGTYLVTVGAAATVGSRSVYGISSVQVTVANEVPTVEIDGGNFTVNRGETRVLVAKVTDPGLDDRHRFDWDLPAGNRSGPGGFAVPVTFDEPGTHTVTVGVTDSDGGQGTASIQVTVRPDAPALAGPNFGADPAGGRGARVANIVGFNGGHPELMVRFHGHAPDALDTVGISVSQVGLGTDLAGLIFDRVFGASTLNLLAVIEQALLPRVAQFLGKLAAEGGSDYARMMRDLPSEVAGIDLAATRALLGVRGKDGPVEVDLLYLEGGTPRVLRRWKVANVPAAEGLRVTFDWIELEGTLERVTPDGSTGSPLKGSGFETVAPVFSAFGEQRAGDRTGPAVVGILNPAVDRVTVLTRDNLTAETNIVLFAVFDANENGRLDDDTFYPLDTNVVDFARLPKRPFAVVGVDEQGNVGALDPFRVSETRNFLGTAGPGETESEYERKLKAIQAAVRSTIVQARDSEVIRGRFLLDPDDLWVFEQGSGANLWKANFVSRCNGIYIPGKSDNDYELFLPVHLENRFGKTEADRLRFEAAGPHSRAMLEGDWYFKRPLGLDGSGNPTEDDGLVSEWEYTLPPGVTVGGQSSFRVTRRETDENLAVGFHSPLTPAEVIAREFLRTVTSDPARRKLLPDTSFFPERREHFMFGRLHLQRPPEFGDDPIGDGGTGRQMLMLKWLLEGAYVTATDGGGAGGFSPGAPALTDIFGNWVRAGVPRVEGYEWGIFHDFAALKSKPFQVAEMRFSPTGADGRLRLLQRSIDDAVAQQQAARLKKLGKSAIRATLARLAGDTNLNGLITGIPAGRLTDPAVRSFEHEILRLARSTEESKGAFGEFAEDRDDLTEPPDIGDFLKAKNGDREYLATILHEPGAYERFVLTTFRFLREVVQAPTAPAYRDYTGGLQAGGGLDELFQRTDNLNRVTRGNGPDQPGLLALNGDRRIARLNLPLAVEVYGPGSAGVIRVRSRRSSIGNPGPDGGGRNARPADTELDGAVVAEFDGAANLDNTVDGRGPGEVLVTQEGAAGETTVEEAMSGATENDETVEQDNSVEVVSSLIAMDIPAPVVSDRPLVFLGITPAGRENFFLLKDWPELEFRHQSPRHVLRLTDRLSITVLAPSGVGDFSAFITTQSDPVAKHVLIREFKETGMYENDGTANQVRFSNVNNPLDDLLYVKDEEILEVRVSGPGLDDEEVIRVMIDLGEFAMASVEHHDRADSLKPRFDFESSFLDAADGFKWADAGVIEFPDDVARAAVDAGVPDGDNAMRRFLQAFGDPTNLATGEADVLYLHTHGTASGLIRDHISDALPGRTNRATVLNPLGHLAEDGRWNSDADWFISEACAILFGGLDGAPLPPGSPLQVGALNWREVMRSSTRPPHGILGFAFGKTADRSVARKFLSELGLGHGYVDSWKAACEAGNPPMPWAALYYSSTRDDTVRELTQHPLPGGAIRYDSFVGIPEGLCFDATECCAGDAHRTQIQAGLWVKTELLGQTVPTEIPVGLPARTEGLLQPGAELAGFMKRSAELESLWGSGARRVLSVPGAIDGDEARRRAEAFLAECGIGSDRLRWSYTGEARQQTFVGDVLSEPVVTARVVRYEVMSQGLPVSGSGVTVNVTPEGITRVGVLKVPMPQKTADVERARPMKLEAALAEVWAARPNSATDARVVVMSKLCWKAVGPGGAKVVPAWDVQWAPADSAGAATGVPQQIWIDAVHGRILEVSK